jgi:hypothetical protein
MKRLIVAVALIGCTSARVPTAEDLAVCVTPEIVPILQDAICGTPPPPQYAERVAWCLAQQAVKRLLGATPCSQ